ncbi:MAG: hypothetical protein JWO03_3445 [Bacteroidetes bacterium]|nr:hypothetical protein [Bacteroidota bacterium]
MNDMSEDWRLLNQLQYLYNARLVFKPYNHCGHWDREQCEFCAKKFDVAVVENTMQQGYVTEAGDRWVCEKCYGDFGEWFDWG